MWIGAPSSDIVEIQRLQKSKRSKTCQSSSTALMRSLFSHEHGTDFQAVPYLHLCLDRPNYGSGKIVTKTNIKVTKWIISGKGKILLTIHGLRNNFKL